MSREEVIEAMALENSDGICCGMRNDDGSCCLAPSMRKAVALAERNGWVLTQTEASDER